VCHLYLAEGCHLYIALTAAKSHKAVYGKFSAQRLGRKQVIKGVPKKITPRPVFQLGFLPLAAAPFYLRFADYLACPGHNILIGAIPKIRGKVG
jgi:hypothetical protein